ncbi:uncharacterized protein [Musca autumnalis]|uniref:uncharacterized protein n=1 Tax=Musca autumnalis TaxID=221902 RepID=UPI003CE93CBB
MRTTYLWIALAALYSAASAGFYKHIGDDIFYIERSENVTWFAASNNCLNRGMVLVAIDSSEKHQQLETIKDDLHERSWTGGLRTTNDQFRWIFKGQSFNYTNWSKKQPDNDKNIEDCVEVLSHEMTWNDLNCNTLLGYICEEIPAVKEKDKEMQLLKETSGNELTQLKMELGERNNELLNLKLQSDNCTNELSNLKMESENCTTELSKSKLQSEKCSNEMSVKEYIKENVSNYLKDIKEEITRQGISFNEPLTQVLNLALNQSSGISLIDVKNEINRLETSMKEQYSKLSQPTTEINVKNDFGENLSTHLKDIKEEIHRQGISLNEPIAKILGIVLNRTCGISYRNDNSNPIETNEILTSEKNQSTDTVEITGVDPSKFNLVFDKLFRKTQEMKVYQSNANENFNFYF